MESWTDTTFELNNSAFLSVCSHPKRGTVGLSHPGYSNRGGNGFCILFTRANLPALRELVAELEALAFEETSFNEAEEPSIDEPDPETLDIYPDPSELMIP